MNSVNYVPCDMTLTTHERCYNIVRTSLSALIARFTTAALRAPSLCWRTTRVHNVSMPLTGSHKIPSARERPILWAGCARTIVCFPLESFSRHDNLGQRIVNIILAARSLGERTVRIILATRDHGERAVHMNSVQYVSCNETVAHAR